MSSWEGVRLKGAPLDPDASGAESVLAVATGAIGEARESLTTVMLIVRLLPQLSRETFQVQRITPGAHALGDISPDDALRSYPELQDVTLAQESLRTPKGCCEQLAKG